MKSLPCAGKENLGHDQCRESHQIFITGACSKYVFPCSATSARQNQEDSKTSQNNGGTKTIPKNDASHSSPRNAPSASIFSAPTSPHTKHCRMNSPTSSPASHNTSQSPKQQSRQNRKQDGRDKPHSRHKQKRWESMQQQRNVRMPRNALSAIPRQDNFAEVTIRSKNLATQCVLRCRECLHRVLKRASIRAFQLLEQYETPGSSSHVEAQEC
jgi:hypothetical protein